MSGSECGDQARRKRRRVKRQATVSWEDYNTYLRSPQWKAVRQRFLASKFPKICYGCRRPWGKGDHLHHRTYRTLGNERLADVVPLCQSCHAQVHRIYEERGVRGTVGLRRATRAVTARTERMIDKEFRAAAQARRPPRWAAPSAPPSPPSRVRDRSAPVPDSPSMQATPPVSANHPAAGATTCQATTKKGLPCPTGPRPSGLCHIHDPAVQCGAETPRGRCAKATGGGPCPAHR